MKKFLLLLLVFSTPVFAQTEEPTQKKEMSPFLKKMIGRFGYGTLEEFHQNNYGILSLGSTSIVSSPYQSTGVSLNFGGLLHRKNKFYTIHLVNVDYLWGNQDSSGYRIGYQIGFGLSFYDKRDYKGSGWLAGFNAELGANYINSNYDFGGASYTAGVSFRGLYRNDYGIGMTLSLLLAYNYSSTYGYGLYIGSHGFEIKPSIGFAY